MKYKIILIPILLIILFSMVLYATVLRTIEDTIIDQSGTVGTWNADHSLSNITDGNYTTYAVTHVNNTFANINFTKEDGSSDSSKVQITYNTSSESTGTNYTLSDFPICWSNDADKLLFRLASNFTQNLSNGVINETVIPVVTSSINETIILLNATAILLTSRNVINTTLTVFNQTIRVNIVNETNLTNSNLVWNNGSNVTLLNTDNTSLVSIYNCSRRLPVVNETNLTNSNLVWNNGTNVTLINTNYVGSVSIYNCSRRIPIFNESNNTNSDLVWINGTNLTLLNTNYVGLTSVQILNCTNASHHLLNSSNNGGNFTVYSDGNIFVTSNVSIQDGESICVNYTYQGLGFGTELANSNYTAFGDGNIFMTSNSTIPDNTGFCTNYTYQELGYGTELASSNYTVYADGNITMTSNSTFSDGLGFCANYTYHGIGYGEALNSSNYTSSLSAGTITLAETKFNNTAVGVNYTYSTPVTLANIRILNNTVRLFNRTVNTTVLNESGFTWLNNTNLTLMNGNLTGLLKIYNCSGSSYEELGSGNWTEFSTDGKIFMTSNGTFADGQPVCINYSYWGNGLGEAVFDSNYSIDYLSGNLSILDSKWNGTLGINYTFLNDSTEKNKRECYNGTDWISLGAESDQDELFDIRMFWLLSGSEWDIDYYRVSPLGVTDVDYHTSTSTSILFNITVNLTLAAGNQTTVNLSLYTRMNNTADYTINVSDLLLTNGSYVNTTITFVDGDRIWWYWAFEDNQSRSIENTSARVIDITTDYAILSIGTNKVVNISTTNGEITTRGGITAANITIDLIKINQNTTSLDTICNNDRRGYIYYDNTTNKFYGCNSTFWNTFN